MPSNPDPTSALFQAARNYIATFQPGRACCRVVVYLEDGQPALDARVAPVAVQPPALAEPPAPLAAPDPPCLNEMEETIIEAIGENTLTGQQIADAAGYPFERSLRACLASLRRRGILSGNHGDPGYSFVSP